MLKRVFNQAHNGPGLYDLVLMALLIDNDRQEREDKRREQLDAAKRQPRPKRRLPGPSV